MYARCRYIICVYVYSANASYLPMSTENAGKITYIDKAQVYYKYKKTNWCKKNKGGIKEHLLQ